MCRSETERMQMAWRSSSPRCSPPRPNRINSSGHGRPNRSTSERRPRSVCLGRLARHELQPTAVISGRNHLQARLLTPLAGTPPRCAAGPRRPGFPVSEQACPLCTQPKGRLNGRELVRGPAPARRAQPAAALPVFAARNWRSWAAVARSAPDRHHHRPDPARSTALSRHGQGGLNNGGVGSGDPC